MKNVFEDLEYRGLIDNITSPDLKEKLDNDKLTFYIGIDPTADSLHIGHLCSLLTAKRLENGGHNSIVLLGGGTGLIGDPKPTNERPMISKEEVLKNVEKISEQISTILAFNKTINNYEWLGNINAIDFLRDYGKYFSINYMIDKDTVKRRLDIGITYTEFSYMLLQSIDFLKLYESEKCALQIGGQDQWGNITAGLDLIRKKHENSEAYGLTMPLIVKADGTKFGKSENGTIWLSKEKTSSYELYQFFYNAEDDKVIEYIKKFTFLSKEDIDTLEIKVIKDPHLREAQKILAKEVVTLLHGKEATDQAIKISEALFNGNITDLTKEQIEEGFKEVPNFKINESINIVDLLIETEMATSKREAKEFIDNGAISLNDIKITDENYIITNKIAVLNEYAILKRGKKKYLLIKF